MVLGRADDTMNLGGIKVSIKHKFLFFVFGKSYFPFQMLNTDKFSGDRNGLQ